MMTSSDSAEARIVCSCSRCGDGSGASSASSAMPEDAVHRRPDLVAHVGQEVALGAAGLFGPILRLGELRGALRDLLLEVLLVALQLEVAGLDLRQHVVERADQHAQLLDARVVLDAQAVVARRRHPLGGAGEHLDGEGDRALQAMAEADGQRHRQHEDHRRDADGAPDAAFELAQVRADEHPADRLAVEGHGAHDGELAAAGGDAVGAGERRRRGLPVRV